MSVVRVAIAGSTGSIGTQTLDVISRSGGEYEVVGLGVGRNADEVIAQAKLHKPKMVAVHSEGSKDGFAGIAGCRGGGGPCRVGARC